ncbi:MAG: hypothetical protein ACI8WB_004858 [Phenylobacterium sp.]|jgi:hypothetical protein
MVQIRHKHNLQKISKYCLILIKTCYSLALSVVQQIARRSRKGKIMKDQAKKDNENMAIYLKRLRHDQNHTMRSLAQLLGTPHSFVGKIEKQGRRLDVGEFIHYCRIMNKQPDEVLRAIMVFDRQ